MCRWWRHKVMFTSPPSRPKSPAWPRSGLCRVSKASLEQGFVYLQEPRQEYGSNQVEVAWTVIPILIVVALFMATARVIADIQKASPSANAVEVVAIGHQFWWEYRYPSLGVVTANELHVPVSDPGHPTPTFIKLLSADTDHSFWVPRLAG